MGSPVYHGIPTVAMEKAIETAALMAQRSRTAVWRAYYELTKPGITLMVVLSTFAGYVLALPEGLAALQSWERLGHLLLTLLGTALVCGGSSALNHYVEREVDRRMSRTRGRPIASGQITPAAGLRYALGLTFAGLFVLLFINFLTLLLATLTVVGYITVYTPMKQRTPAALYMGAVPGAIPPAGGWIAAQGSPEWGMLLVFLVLYCWQIPHFLALAYLYSKDYAQAGFRVAELGQGRKGAYWHALLASVALLGSTLLLGWHSALGWTHTAGMLLLGLWLLVTALDFARRHSTAAARRMLVSAYGYLVGFVVLSVLR